MADEQQAQPVADNVPAPEPEVTSEPQAAGADDSASGDATQGNAGSDKAAWAADRAGLERQIRDAATIAKENATLLEAANAKNAAWDDPVARIMGSDDGLATYKKLTAAMAHDGAVELSETEQLRADLDAVRSERKAEQEAHAKSVADRTLADAAGRDEAFINESDAHGLVKALGMSSSLAGLRQQMHSEGKRDIQTSEVADEAERILTERVGGQMEALLKVDKFKDMLRGMLDKTTQPARQASEGTKPEVGEATQSLSTLSNQLNGNEVSDIDWSNMDRDEIRVKAQEIAFRELDKQKLSQASG